MKRISLCQAALLIFPVVAAASAQAEEVWSEKEACRAATKVYFFLSDAPRDANAEEGSWGFLSTAGNYYTCRIEGSRALF